MAALLNEVSSPQIVYRYNGAKYTISFFTEKTVVGAIGYLTYAVQPDPAFTTIKKYYVAIVPTTDLSASRIHIRVSGITYALRLAGYSVGTETQVVYDSGNVGGYLDVDMNYYVRNAVTSDAYNIYIHMKSRDSLYVNILETSDSGHRRTYETYYVTSKWPWSDTGEEYHTLALPTGRYRIAWATPFLGGSAQLIDIKVWKP